MTISNKLIQVTATRGMNGASVCLLASPKSTAATVSTAICRMLIDPIQRRHRGTSQTSITAHIRALFDMSNSIPLDFRQPHDRAHFVGDYYKKNLCIHKMVACFIVSVQRIGHT